MTKIKKSYSKLFTLLVILLLTLVVTFLASLFYIKYSPSDAKNEVSLILLIGLIITVLVLAASIKFILQPRIIIIVENNNITLHLNRFKKVELTSDDIININRYSFKMTRFFKTVTLIINAKAGNYRLNNLALTKLEFDRLFAQFTIK